MRTSYDVIVIGAGSMGMSAGYFLAKQGVKTLLLDAFDPPHTSGSHHGDTRLIRHAYTGSSAYTSLALRADRLWTDLEAATGERLLVRSGVLNAASADDRSMEEKWNRAQEFGLQVESLSADEIRKRWPGIELPETYRGLYESEAGYVFSEACVRAYRQQALAHGAVLLANTPVKRIEAANGGATVYTDAGVFTADRLIVSLGAWFGSIGNFLPLPIRAVRKAVAWFASEKGLFEEGSFPGFTIGGEGTGTDYYGFPSMNGSGVKIGRHDSGQLWTPGQPFEPFGAYPEDEQDLRQALQVFMPRAAGKVLRGVVCKYELTPDEDFIIDKHPEHDHIWIAGGFSGHGFKFASAIGEVLSELATKQTTEQDLSPFAISRFK